MEEHAFYDACVTEKWDAVFTLINSGEIPVDFHNGLALRSAAEGNRLDIIQQLVERGANVTAYGEYPLVRACCHGYMDIIEYLFSKGLHVNEENNTPIRCAIRGGHLHAVKYLILRGCKLLVNDKYYRDSFEVACVQGHLDMVRYLERRVSKYKQTHHVWIFTDWEWIQMIRNSVNMFLYIQRDHPLLKYNETQHLFGMLLMIVNLIKGYIRCFHQYSFSLLCDETSKEACLDCKEWGKEPYYDPHIGMLICSYVD